MRYTGPKNKVSRREGMDLGLKTPGSKAQGTLLRKINITPGQHGAKHRRKTSERGRQLREKQKVKAMFGVSEAQLRNYFDDASRQAGNTGENLIRLLEKRLDNVVYRMGFAPTRAAARQLVNHNHVTVNDKRISVASYSVSENDVITFKNSKTKDIPYIAAMFEIKDALIPAWLQTSATVGKVIAMPDAEEVTKMVNLRLVVEFYSK